MEWILSKNQRNIPTVLNSQPQSNSKLNQVTQLMIQSRCYKNKKTNLKLLRARTTKKSLTQKTSVQLTLKNTRKKLKTPEKKSKVFLTLLPVSPQLEKESKKQENLLKTKPLKSQPNLRKSKLTRPKKMLNGNKKPWNTIN